MLLSLKYNDLRTLFIFKTDAKVCAPASPIPFSCNPISTSLHVFDCNAAATAGIALRGCRGYSGRCSAEALRSRDCIEVVKRVQLLQHRSIPQW
jgi:hypothetical protein